MLFFVLATACGGGSGTAGSACPLGSHREADGLCHLDDDSGSPGGALEPGGAEVPDWDAVTVGATLDSIQTLMSGLSTILADLQARPGPAGGTLLDETTVVVLSEMGRYPKLDSRGGKEHWTYTSAMLIGAGVRGGTVVGGYDPDSFQGRPVDLETGEERDDGASLLPGHLGATLLALGGVDPEAWVGDKAPIAAVMEA